MSFFTRDETVLANPERFTTRAPAALPGWWESAGAAWEADEIDKDRRGRFAAAEWAILEPMAARHLEPEYRRRWENGAGQKGWDPVLEDLFAKVAADPDRPKEWPTSHEQFVDMRNRRLRAEIDDARAVAAMGGWSSNFAGGMASTLATPVGAGSMLIGGPQAYAAKTVLGAGLRVGAFEGVMGGVGAALDLPDQIRVADELNLPRPNPVAEVVAGSAAGAGMGFVLGAGGRGLVYLRDRRNVGPPPPGMELRDHIAATEAAARALETGAPLPPPPPSTAEFARKIAQVESGGDATARNPSSTAFGAGQFVKGTWLELMRRRRPDLTQGKTEEEILALRSDSDLSDQMIAAYANENLRSLTQQGVPQASIGQGELYLAHFAGPGGAARLLKAAPETPVSELLSADAITANISVLEGKTAGEVISWAREKIGAPPPAPLRQTLGSAEAFQEAFPRVTAASGQSVDVRWEIADMDRLQAATGDLQPRDRAGRISSDEQIAEIAARLNPSRLLPSPEASRGAPIVGPDDIVESGNGRVAALRQAMEVNPDAYIAYRERLRSLGFPVEGVERPVLIGRRVSALSDEERRAFVVGANSADVMRMSPSEQARVDADAISPGDLAGFESMGQLFGREGQGFIARFMDGLPQAERAGMDTDGGQLSIKGEERIRNAVFAKAFDDPVMLRAMTETGAEEAKGMMTALSEAAPAWARLRQAVEKGEVSAEYDATGRVADAFQTVAKARRQAAAEGRPVATVLREALDQADMFGGGARGDFIAEAMIRHGFYKDGRARAAGEVAELLRNYARLAQAMGDARPRLDLGDEAPLSPEAAFSHALRQTFGEEAAPPPPAPVLESFDAGASAPAARTAMESERMDMTKLIEEGGDFDVFDEAGNLVPASQALAEAEAWTQAAAAVKICRPKGN